MSQKDREGWSEVSIVGSELTLKLGGTVSERSFGELRKCWTVQVDAVEENTVVEFRGSVKYNNDCRIRIEQSYGLWHNDDSKFFLPLPDLFAAPRQDADGRWVIAFAGQAFHRRQGNCNRCGEVGHWAKDVSVCPYIPYGSPRSPRPPRVFHASNGLKITFTIHFRRDLACQCRACVPVPAPDPAPPSRLLTLSSDFRDLFNNPQFSDFVIEVAGEMILVNKAILSARSPYFKGLFASRSKEAMSGVIRIEDGDPILFYEVVKYFYCGVLPEDLDGDPTKYFQIADTYGMEDLKLASVASMMKLLEQMDGDPMQYLRIAEAFEIEDLKIASVASMMKQLTRENLQRYLVIAKEYKITDLKQNCIKAMKKQLRKEDVVGTLIFAHRHRFLGLKKRCIKKIGVWREDLSESAFEPLKEYPDLIVKCLKAV